MKDNFFTLYPAIDIKDGKCVRLLFGEMEKETVYNNNPLDQAMWFVDQGAEWLHIVDLDGAVAGKNINKKVAIAGSVSTFGSLYKYGVEAMVPGFKEQLNILSGEGVDLILLEAMSSQADIVETIIESTKERASNNLLSFFIIPPFKR